jgi:hypothetical protein
VKSTEKKAAPFLGPRFKEVKVVGVSGKAMQVTVPPVGTALREMLNRELSEGHCCGFAASLVPVEGAFAEPKAGEGRSAVINL